MKLVFALNAERFKHEMLVQNKNVHDIVQETGLAFVTISNLMKGTRKAHVKTCNKLAKALNVPVEELFTVE
ncbi:helix-turn-helix domain-containing protein [Veillonella sp. R32]|uniref:helix-turn-helix domain-containing protein n=1 Tax=Veillonella sp. R32 TaxID=2021312 RepID=UPI001389FE73|nr:helix-turn-helix transcriptional regulator [Veillonella sp. R32]KAF1679106.1 hypothetical protein VER_09655 [Veillonella sp. R32]